MIGTFDTISPRMPLLLPPHRSAAKTYIIFPAKDYINDEDAEVRRIATAVAAGQTIVGSGGQWFL